LGTNSARVALVPFEALRTNGAHVACVTLETLGTNSASVALRTTTFKVMWRVLP
jgi:hypothetical protein